MSTEEVFERITQIIRDVLDQPGLTITRDTTAEDVEGWDSFNHINITVAVEMALGVKFNTAEVEELRNVGEFVDLTVAKLEKKRAR